MTMKSLLTLTLLASSVSLASAANLSATSPAVPADDSLVLRKSIQDARDPLSKALRYKELGDFYATRDNYQQAATAYISALELYRGFPEKERFKMVVALSLGDRLTESISETRLLLNAHPANTEARIHLAKNLSWAGNIQEALTEAEIILKQLPDQKDALLVKANALNWQGRPDAAAPIYRSLLAKEDSFDARLGLAYCLLNSENINEAEATAKLLRPTLPYQQRELGNFNAALKKATTPITADQRLAALRSAIQNAPDAATKSQRYKDLGDYYAAQDNGIASAAAEYLNALALYRGFPEGERLRMVIALSQADRLKESISETRLILADNPANTAARIHLARCLSWSGELREALTEADKVLAQQPGNRDALLVKANCLNWQGRQPEAITIYRNLLSSEDTFDARLGLAYCLLTIGKVTEAREHAGKLRPVYPYQERELGNFNKAYKRTTAQEIDVRYSFYDDTDGNMVSRYGTGYSFWLGDVKMGVSYQHTAAHDRTATSASANDIWLRAYTRLNSVVGVGAATGVTITDKSNSNSYLNGQLMADFSLPISSLGVVLARETMTDTASIIKNNIRAYSATLNASQNLTDRLALFETYTYRDFSDSNNSHSAQLSPVYTIYSGLVTAKVGYRLRYMTFDRYSGNGYFDPKDFVSHLAFLNISLDQGPWYGYVEPYGGFQSFRRNGNNSNDFFSGFSGLAGYRFTENLRGEVNGEFGNYAVQTTSGFEYYLVGGRLVFSF